MPFEMVNHSHSLSQK